MILFALLDLLLLVTISGANVTPAAPIYDDQTMNGVIKPCVLDNRCLPPVRGFNVEAAADILKSITGFKTLEECQCDLSKDSCLRSCYYAQTVYIYMAFAPWKAESLGISVEKSKERYREYLEKILKPCIMSSLPKDCGASSNLLKLDLARMKIELENYASLFRFPTEDKSCQQLPKLGVRPCYYALIRRMNLSGPAEAVIILLSVPFS